MSESMYGDQSGTKVLTAAIRPMQNAFAQLPPTRKGQERNNIDQPDACHDIIDW
jgi:hypothetical protein